MVLPSQSRRGAQWLGNFIGGEREAARLLIDSLTIEPLQDVLDGIRRGLNELNLTEAGEGVLIPILSLEDIESDLAPTNHSSPPVRHVAYETFSPGHDIAVTPGSEGIVGNTIREFTGARPGHKKSNWLHPSSSLEKLKESRVRKIVLVTDYAGSGQQASAFAQTFPRNATLRSWRSFGWITIVVICHALSSEASERLRKEEAIDEVVSFRMAPSFHTADWTSEQRRRIESLCVKYTPQNKRSLSLGFNGSRSLYMTMSAVPNNLPYILYRRSSIDWKGLFDGRVVCPDFAGQVIRHSPRAEATSIASRAGQARLGDAIESRAPSNVMTSRIVAILALARAKPLAWQSVAQELSLRPDAAKECMNFLILTGLIDSQGNITENGLREVRVARRRRRTTTSGLRGRADLYYPEAMR